MHLLTQMQKHEPWAFMCFWINSAACRWRKWASSCSDCARNCVDDVDTWEIR